MTSATANVIKALPLILKDKPRSQKDIWQYLIINNELKKQLITTDGRPRVGILQGITTRVKDGRLPDFKLIKTSDGHTKIAFIGNTAFQRANYAHQLLEEVHALDVGGLVEDEKKWQQWNNIETKLASLDRDLTKFIETAHYAKPTETFYPKKAKPSYPISKFKHNSK